MPKHDKKEFSEKMEQEEKFEEIEAGKEITEEIKESAEESAAAKALADKYLDGWKRCQADFENYKKRQGESVKDLLRYANEIMILQLLPIIDNFHASTGHIPEDQKASSWVTGIMHIQKQLEKVLEDNGVTEIAVKVGDDFDPAVHEAIADAKPRMKSESTNKIRQIVLRGYKMGPARNASHSDAGGDKIIRAAKVIVE